MIPRLPPDKTPIPHTLDAQQLSLDLTPKKTTPLSEYSRAKNIPGLTITLSNRLTRSWHMRIGRGSFSSSLHIPACFENAPRTTHDELLDWVEISIAIAKRTHPTLRLRKKEIESRIFVFLNSAHVPRRTVHTVNPSAFQFLSQGVTFNLTEVFTDLNKRFFDSKLTSLCKFGTPGSTRSFQTIKKNKSGEPCSVITIAGIYDHPEVPLFAIEGILYHELLHEAIPPYSKNGRRVIHGPEFKQAERAFPGFGRWREWEKTELHRLIRKFRRSSRWK